MDKNKVEWKFSLLWSIYNSGGNKHISKQNKRKKGECNIKNVIIVLHNCCMN